MYICKEAGIDAIILFPQAGPETERAWIEYALEENLGVIVGGLMTHPKYVRSEGGFLADEAIMEMYLNAADQGITDFVVPGNKPDEIMRIRKALEQKGISSNILCSRICSTRWRNNQSCKSCRKQLARNRRKRNL